MKKLIKNKYPYLHPGEDETKVFYDVDGKGYIPVGTGFFDRKYDEIIDCINDDILPNLRGGTPVVQDGSITTEKLDNKAVTREKLSDGVNTLLDDLTNKECVLEDGSVTEAKLGNKSVTTSKLGDDVSSLLNDLINKPCSLADGSVTETKLADNAVTETKLADNAVTETKLADNAVTETKFGDNVMHFFADLHERISKLENSLPSDDKKELPVGTVLTIAQDSNSPDVDSGEWRALDGSWLDDARYYEDLVAVFNEKLEKKIDIASGRTLIRLPNANGRATVSYSGFVNTNGLILSIKPNNSTLLGEIGGSEVCKLALNEIPAHKHILFTEYTTRRIAAAGGTGIHVLEHAVGHGDSRSNTKDIGETVLFETKATAYKTNETAGVTEPFNLINSPSTSGECKAHNILQPVIMFPSYIKVHMKKKPYKAGAETRQESTVCELAQSFCEKLAKLCKKTNKE